MSFLEKVIELDADSLGIDCKGGRERAALTEYDRLGEAGGGSDSAHAHS
jgi:hypothetical protein